MTDELFFVRIQWTDGMWSLFLVHASRAATATQLAIHYARKQGWQDGTKTLQAIRVTREMMTQEVTHLITM